MIVAAERLRTVARGADVVGAADATEVTVATARAGERAIASAADATLAATEAAAVSRTLRCLLCPLSRCRIVAQRVARLRRVHATALQRRLRLLATRFGDRIAAAVVVAGLGATATLAVLVPACLVAIGHALAVGRVVLEARLIGVQLAIVVDSVKLLTLMLTLP